MVDIIYLKMRGERQGDISAGCGTKDSIGNRLQLGHENEIFVFGLSNCITGTGNGMNLQGLSFSKLVDKSSPLLSMGISNNEKFFLEFSFYRINPHGKREKYYFIELRGATQVDVRINFSNNNLDTETVSVRYEYILCKHLTANTEFSYLAFPAEYNSLFSPQNPIVAAQQAEKQRNTLNSKGAGRLLAAGGIYNGNVEGFHKTAEQLGGDAPTGYDQIMDNKGMLIAGASVAAGLGLGRLSAIGEIEDLSVLSKAPKLSPSEFVNFETRQLQKKFKHAVDFNISGNPSAESLKTFELALKKHIDDPLTQQITGKYRWSQDVYHYYNPDTKIDVMTKMDGNFISGWKLSETQMSDLIGEGNVF